MTPTAYQKGGAGMKINYTIADPSGRKATGTVIVSRPYTLKLKTIHIRFADLTERHAVILREQRAAQN